MKMTVFLDVTLCRLVEIDRSYCNRPDDGSCKHLWNVCKFFRDYTVNIAEEIYLHTRRRENLKFYCNESAGLLRTDNFGGMNNYECQLSKEDCVTTRFVDSTDSPVTKRSAEIKEI
jgi:hypothetical protein